MRIFIIAVLLMPFLAVAQVSLQNPGDTIYVGTNTTVFVYLDQDIKEIVLGSGVDISGYSDVYIKNDDKRIDMLARVPNFVSTNILIETHEGSVYSYNLVYSEESTRYIYKVLPSSAVLNKGVIDPKDIKEEVLSKNGIQIDEQSLKISSKKAYEMENRGLDIGTVHHKSKVQFSVDGIFIDGNHLLIKMGVLNTGNIDYDVDLIRFVIEGKGKDKRKKAAAQEEAKDPLYVYNKIDKIKKDSYQSSVFAFEKFTISNNKQFIVEFWEINGDRSVDVIVRSKDIINAELLD